MRNEQWYAADDLTQRIRHISVPSNYELNGSYIVFYSAAPSVVPAVHVQVRSEAVQEQQAQQNNNTNVTSAVEPSQDLQAELLPELSTAVQLNELITQLELGAVPNDAPQVTQPAVEVKVVPVVATSMMNSVVDAKSPESEIKMTSSLTSSAPAQPKTIIVRKLGAKRGGAEVVNPQSIQELLTVGGELLEIHAVKVRRVRTEAEIRDLNAIQHEEVVFLTTEEDEKDFD